MANSQTEIFRRRVSDCLGTPPPTAPQDSTVAEAVDCLRETRASGLVLTDDDNRPVGLLTEADVTRRIVFDLPPHTRYLEWLGGMLQGDFGRSLANDRPIADLIGVRFANTLFLALIAAIIRACRGLIKLR